MSIFILPDLGEGLPEAEIVEWHIKEGDEVKADQVIVSMETAKAIVDIPSPHSGKIEKLFGQPGDIIHTGDPLLEFAGEENKQEAASTSSPESTPRTPDTKEVGKEKESSTVVGELPQANEKLKETADSVSHSNVGIKATPAVRALAHRLNIDLSMVTPSGPKGTIKASDVQRVAKILSEVGNMEPVKGVRRSMAIAMSQAHSEVVPVTLNDDADITIWAKDTDITARIIRAMIKACEIEPALNGWFDSHALGRRLLKQVHLGLAVDTPDGLFVPVIRDAQNLDEAGLREKINTLKSLIKERKIPPEDLRGNTITLSNFGSIGGKYANPIVLPPTMAILGTGRVFKQTMITQSEKGDNQCNEHSLLPLSLSFDHRTVTGGEAGRFLQVVIQDLERET